MRRLVGDDVASGEGGAAEDADDEDDGHEREEHDHEGHTPLASALPRVAARGHGAQRPPAQASALLRSGHSGSASAAGPTMMSGQMRPPFEPSAKRRRTRRGSASASRQVPRQALPSK